MHQLSARAPFLPRISPDAARYAIISSLMDSQLRVAATLGLLVSLGACVDQERPVYEAPSRLQAPTPVCAEGIAPPKRNKGDSKAVVRDLEPEQWLEIMVPEYD